MGEAEDDPPHTESLHSPRYLQSRHPEQNRAQRSGVEGSRRANDSRPGTAQTTDVGYVMGTGVAVSGVACGVATGEAAGASGSPGIGSGRSLRTVPRGR